MMVFTPTPTPTPEMLAFVTRHPANLQPVFPGFMPALPPPVCVHTSHLHVSIPLERRS